MAHLISLLLPVACTWALTCLAARGALDEVAAALVRGLATLAVIVAVGALLIVFGVISFAARWRRGGRATRTGAPAASS